MAFDDKMRGSITQYVCVLEMVLYATVGVLLIVAASVEVVRSGAALWRGFNLETTTTTGLLALDHLLLVLMLIELLHTVRISIRTQHLTMVPFLIVGLIASIRRVLVITMHAATMAEEGYKVTPEQAIAFRYSMIELGLAAILILVFVHSIIRLRAASHKSIKSSQPS